VVEEVGESFYNPFIPSTIARLQEAGLVEVEEGMLIIKLPHFVIPLIVRKSDGTDVLTVYELISNSYTRIKSTLA
jgi:arginyl-tRNA synthetase